MQLVLKSNLSNNNKMLHKESSNSTKQISSMFVKIEPPPPHFLSKLSTIETNY